MTGGRGQVASGESKGELRGHDHVIECVTFANAKACQVKPLPPTGQMHAGLVKRPATVQT
eukprot:2863323-Rhodomonas_salina.1